MIAGALRQFLAGAGLSPVSVSVLGDYTAAGGPAWAVHVESDSDAELAGAVYRARIQIRARAADAIVAENAGRRALDLLLSTRGLALPWSDPTGEQDRTYRLATFRIVNRPTWYPTETSGEEVSANVRALVEEIVP